VPRHLVGKSRLENSRVADYLPGAAATSPVPFAALKTGTARQPSKEAAVAWIILFFAGLLEIVWAFAMKLSDGFSRPVPTVVTILAMFLSFGLLAWAMKSLPLGTAYTVWTGIGAVGAFVVGVAVLGEAASPMRVLAAMLIVGGLILMKVSSPA
jgi:quaternary ammonium compound-resistance protein SugE